MPFGCQPHGVGYLFFLRNFAQTNPITMTQSRISKRIQSLAVSQTLAMSQKSSELRANGVDVINLSVGEPDFATPDNIKEAAKRAIDENYSHYSPVPGYLSLRRAIADSLARELKVTYSTDQIVVSGGAKQSLSNAVLALVNDGDEVVIPVPAWVSYVEMVKLAGGVPVTVAADITRDFKISPEQLEAAITDRTRLIMLCSPSNPSGAVYSHAELQGLVDLLARHPQVVVLSDEIYRHINYQGGCASLTAFPEIADRLVLVNGVSKAYAMTGWRIGFIAAPLDIAKACSKLQGQTTSGCSSIAQKAAEEAYNGPQESVELMRQAFERRRNLVVDLAAQIPGLKFNVPQGAFYLFPEVTAFLGKSYVGADGATHTVATDSDLAMYLLEEAHVATVAGSAFSLPGYLRLSYAASDEQLAQAMERIRVALARLA